MRRLKDFTPLLPKTETSRSHSTVVDLLTTPDYEPFALLDAVIDSRLARDSLKLTIKPVKMVHKHMHVHCDIARGIYQPALGSRSSPVDRLYHLNYHASRKRRFRNERRFP